VEGDRRLLRIVLENLLGNAWKYTSRRPEADVEFGCERRSGLTVFYVRDNGAGFDASAADRLFQPFQRLHSASEFPGSGVGLATVQRIIARHGGEVWAASSPGEGATFFFTLGQRAHSSLAHTG
jgi:signal transduction histidine kinase